MGLNGHIHTYLCPRLNTIKKQLFDDIVVTDSNLESVCVRKYNFQAISISTMNIINIYERIKCVAL